MRHLLCVCVCVWEGEKKREIEAQRPITLARLSGTYEDTKQKKRLISGQREENHKKRNPTCRERGARA